MDFKLKYKPYKSRGFISMDIKNPFSEEPIISYVWSKKKFTFWLHKFDHWRVFLVPHENSKK